MRTLATLIICAVSTTVAAGRTYLLEGQISSGTSLFTVNEPLIGTNFHGLGFPEGGYPVNYTAILATDADVELWEFRFQATDFAESVLHVVDGPSATDMGTTNETLFNASQLTLDFHRFATYGTKFELEINLQTKTGAWIWAEFCPVCDLSHALPSAVASVTSIRVVPESNSLLLVLVGSAIVLSHRRREKRTQPITRLT